MSGRDCALGQPPALELPHHNFRRVYRDYCRRHDNFRRVQCDCWTWHNEFPTVMPMVPTVPVSGKKASGGGEQSDGTNE